MHILGAIAEFERERIRERVLAGLQRARREGKKLSRPVRTVSEVTLAPVRGLFVRAAAKRLGVSPSTAQRWLSKGAAERAILEVRRVVEGDTNG